MTVSAPNFFLRAQIEEVDYELGQRRNVYARLVSTRKMRGSVAKMHLDRMEAVLRTLRWLHANEVAIRAHVDADRKAPKLTGA